MALLIARKYAGIVLVWGSLLIASPLFAQVEPENNGQSDREHRDENNRQDEQVQESFREKLFTGGDMGAWVGNVTYVNLSPILGYWITEEELAAGAGVTYQYYNNKDISFATSVYGGNIFLRYYFDETVFAHGQYEVLNVEAYDQFHDRMNVPALLLGGGYSQPMGDHAAFAMMFLWNFSENKYTPYNNPVIRAGFTIGF